MNAHARIANDAHRALRLLRNKKPGDAIAAITVSLYCNLTACPAFVMDVDSTSNGFHLHWAGDPKKIPHAVMAICDFVDIYPGGKVKRIKDRYAAFGKITKVVQLEQPMTLEEAREVIAQFEAGDYGMTNFVFKEKADRAFDLVKRAGK